MWPAASSPPPTPRRIHARNSPGCGEASAAGMPSGSFTAPRPRGTSCPRVGTVFMSLPLGFLDWSSFGPSPSVRRGGGGSSSRGLGPRGPRAGLPCWAGAPRGRPRDREPGSWAQRGAGGRGDAAAAAERGGGGEAGLLAWVGRRQPSRTLTTLARVAGGSGGGRGRSGRPGASARRSTGSRRPPRRAAPWRSCAAPAASPASPPGCWSPGCGPPAGE